MKRFAACLLSLSLLLTPALAAGTDPRREDLDFLCASLQDIHPGFDALVDKAAFTAKKAEIEARIPTATDQEFALDLQSLVALLGDSHTTTNLSPVLSSSPLYLFELGWYDGSWVLLAAPAGNETLVGRTVAALNGVAMEEVVSRLSVLVSADNPVKLRRQTPQLLMSQAVLHYVGLAEEDSPLILTMTGGETLSLSPLSPEEYAALEPDDMALLDLPASPTAQRRKTAYFSQPLSEKVYYIQYNTCREDPDDPMETFAAQAAADWTAGGYDTLLIDLRYNGGGSDGVLYPILVWAGDLVRSGKTVYCLIGEATFSSAIINAVELRELGAVLAGSPTSGSADHYGSTRSFSLPNSGIRVNCSTKFIDLETLFETGLGLGVESLEPDLPVQQTLSDALAGRDTLVETILAREAPYDLPADPDAPLTRGGLARLLWTASGEPEAGECPFEDVFPLSPSLSAIAWCTEKGVVLGDENAAFSPTRPVTLQEAAVMLYRRAGSPAAAPHGASAPWAAQAMGWLAEQGLIPQGLVPSSPLTQAQGAALLSGLI